MPIYQDKIGLGARLLARGAAAAAPEGVDIKTQLPAHRVDGHGSAIHLGIAETGSNGNGLFVDMKDIYGDQNWINVDKQG